jgi:Uma2 family endonuclease
MDGMTTSSKLITADELLKMGDIGRCELIYGELVMMSPAGAEHGIVANRIAHEVTSFVDARVMGSVFTAETGFKLASDPDLVRAPNVAFVRAERMRGMSLTTFFEGSPDLAVEVTSPDDRRREVADKKNAWLAHGAISVWIADPAAQTITVHHAGVKPVKFARGQKLVDERILSGFELEVDRVFKLP